MKILCITPWFPSHRQDQWGNYILDSLEASCNLGHEITVLITTPWRPSLAKFFKREWKNKTIEFRDFSTGLTLHECKYLSIPRNYCRQFSNLSYRIRVGSYLESLTHKTKHDLIHAHTELAGVVAVDIGKKLNIPTAVTIHGINTDPKIHKGSARRVLFEYPLSQANRVILVGDPLVPFFNKYVENSDHFRIVYNGFRLPQEKQIQKSKWSENLQFISVSNLHEGKGIDINLYALAKIKKNGISNWNYTIIGDGFERNNLENLVNYLNLRENVTFLGAINHDEVYHHLKKSDVFILPSYREAFGIAYLEAMSLGLLTIGVKEQGPQAFIENGKTGFLVAPKNFDDLAKVLQTIFEDKNTMFQIAKQGQSFVYENFTWQQHAKTLEKVYQELV